MAGTNPTDQQILDKLHLTDTEVRDMETKFDAFTKTLNPNQIKSLKKSTPTAAQAVTTLGLDCTPEALDTFIRSRAPHGAPIVLYNQNNDH